jgi:hypothetical protein
MKNEMFWKWVNSTAAPQLAKREVSFRKMFEYLDQGRAEHALVG